MSRTKRWRNPKERRALVAEMYGYTGSVRETAWSLRMRHSDVAADLSMWRREHPGEDAARAGKRLLRRDKRAAEAASLRDRGLSLREIAARQGVSYETVRSDLKRCDAIPQTVNFSCQVEAPGRSDLTGESDSYPQADVIPLHRRTA